MFNRLLSSSLRFVITGLIAIITAVAVMCGYTGFMYLVRIHFSDAMWMLGVAAVSGVFAVLIANRRSDLADC